ncbi:uncharacterized protein K452DRAFT_312977 [Aplosporella prunicola CBS 121167]|uniref:Heterokaryon incompatibility domain-containing protein n=1 Tax=Aplosporella prunicola CBS 121167 TaxID=1176127 RepID=A0A6A6B0F2_9PEZI|nr:uncharacterized protein K452DRAFT_312977 [Aplosporella prunicola CBS 121167]KAF2136694.1 hypothetical protein K452DRAFT_312977 [Aplosporella prunicola CBS 121167]
MDDVIGSIDLWHSVAFKLVKIIEEFQFKSGKSEDIRNILRLGRPKESSDPRDKIYALLGHPAFQELGTGPGKDQFIHISYDIPYQDLYYLVAEQLLKLPNPLYVLGLVQHTAASFKQTDISWVPQWNINAYIGDLEPLPSRCHFNASAETAPVFMLKSKILQLQGIAIDTIKWNAEPFDDFFIGEDIWHWVNLIAPIFYDIRTHLDGFDSAIRSLEEPSILSKLFFALTTGITSYPQLPLKQRVVDMIVFLEHIGFDCSKWIQHNGIEGHGELTRFLSDIINSCIGRSFFITENGQFGLGPEIVLPSDLVCVFFGASVPYVLRPVGDGKYRICGERYMDDFMDGEAIEMLK